MVPADEIVTGREKSPSHPQRQTASLAGRWLTLAHLGWLVVVIFEAPVFLVGVPLFFRATRTPCANESIVSQCMSFSERGFQALERLGIPLEATAAIEFSVILAASLVFFTIGALIAWRKWNDGMALFTSLLFISFGATGVSDLFVNSLSLLPTRENLLWGALLLVASIPAIAEWPALGAFLLTFPTGRFTPRWSALFILCWACSPVVFLLPVPPLLIGFVVLSGFISVLAVQVYRYRRVYHFVQRQQTKWLILSVVTSIGCVLIAALAIKTIPVLSSPDSPFASGSIVNVFSAIFVFLPIALTIATALLRYRLYDIDVLINRALVYGTLTLLLAGLYAACVIGLQSLARQFTGLDSTIAIVVSTLAIAALFQPLRARIQRTVDHRFYRQKYDAAKTLAAFSSTLRDEIDLDELEVRLVDIVDETMQPTSVSLWLR